jgi:hypothetical protein
MRMVVAFFPVVQGMVPVKAVLPEIAAEIQAAYQPISRTVFKTGAEIKGLNGHGFMRI